MTLLEKIMAIISGIAIFFGWAWVKSMKARVKEAEAKIAKEKINEAREKAREELVDRTLSERVDFANKRYGPDRNGSGSSNNSGKG